MDQSTRVPAARALRDSARAITHVLFNTTGGDLPHPHWAGTGRRAARLGWYKSQPPPGLITVISDFGADRFDRLIVPPGASQTSTDTTAAAAADLPTDATPRN